MAVLFECSRTIKDWREVIAMEKECCNVKVTETEDGFQINVKGENLKEKFETVFKSCCGEELKKKGKEFCCGSDK